MVLLTMTPSIVEGLDALEGGGHDAKRKPQEAGADNAQTEKPDTIDPALGKPISHGQVVDLWKKLKATRRDTPPSLEELLRGCRVYAPPPPPKSEPTPEYKALMARLRREEEARSYERMVNPPARPETFHDRFPHAATPSAFAAVNRPTSAADEGDDEVTLNDVHRQVMLVINFLVSIAGVAATLWVAARWWSVPARLFLAMGGSALVAVAEVAVYSGYVWRLGEARGKEGARREVKEVVKTWVVGEDGPEGEDDKTVLLTGKESEGGDGAVRKRHKATQEKT